MSLPQLSLFQQSSDPTSVGDVAISASATEASSPQLLHSVVSLPGSAVHEKRADVNTHAPSTSSPPTSTKRSVKKTFQPPHPDHARERFLRRPEVQHLTGLSRSSLYRLIAANEFPRPVNVSKNAVAWVSSSIDEWMAARIAAAQVTQAKQKER